MGWWITLGVVTLLAVLPLGVRVCYDADGALVKIVLGPVMIPVFPRPKKEKKARKKEEKSRIPKRQRKKGIFPSRRNLR